MTAISKWIKLYNSPNEAIRIRAGEGLLRRGSELSLKLLLGILDNLGDKGLGGKAEKLLLERTDPELTDEMIVRLQSEDVFIREVACGVLGKSGDRKATAHLVRTLSDPHIMVRRAAGFALAELKDPASVSGLMRQYKQSAKDDLNVRFALECALEELKVEFARHPWLA